mmetsp:Transcript_5661/g.21326  ORF Transcript_5661/g.21326 Transcript_5661/m.21326 type:complete len:205 (-) Transcript_5661:289-903(-)
MRIGYKSTIRSSSLNKSVDCLTTFLYIRGPPPYHRNNCSKASTLMYSKCVFSIVLLLIIGFVLSGLERHSSKLDSKSELSIGGRGTRSGSDILCGIDIRAPVTNSLPFAAAAPECVCRGTPVDMECSSSSSTSCIESSLFFSSKSRLDCSSSNSMYLLHHFTSMSATWGGSCDDAVVVPLERGIAPLAASSISNIAISNSFPPV